MGSLKNSSIVTSAEFSGLVSPLKVSGRFGPGTGSRRWGMQDGRTSRKPQAIAIASFFRSVFDDFTERFIRPVLERSPAKGLWSILRRKRYRPTHLGRHDP